MIKQAIKQALSGDLSAPTMSGLVLCALGAGLAVGAMDAQAQTALRNPALFTENTLPADDDDFTDLVPIGFTINFFGTEYSGVYVNNNGNVTFDEGLYEYTPFELLTTQRAILAPFFADVDTRGVGSGVTQYGQNTLDGRAVFGVNWINVGYYGSNVDKLNSFQLVMIDRSDVRPGDFDFEFNYERIQWETGDASGGEGGLGGSSARVGWSDGVANAFELPGSAVNGAFLDGGPNALVSGSLNSNVPGRYLFTVRNGQVGAMLDFDLSLESTGGAVSSALRQSELVMNGAHGRALSRLTKSGENIFWVAGDWGRDDHRDRDGSLGVAEVGVGRNFGPAQINGAAGHTWNTQRLPLSGEFSFEGSYVLAEGLVPLKGDADNGIWLTLGGYYAWGDAKIRRGYMVNGDELDQSTGRPDLELVNVRARVDFSSVAPGDMTVSPFLEVAQNWVRLSGYTETDGSYASRFDQRKQDSTDVRVGFDASNPLNQRLRFLGRVELNHRLDGTGPGTTGELLTVGPFEYDGVEFDQTWARVGAGLEADIGGGTGSFMINATSYGEAPNAWIAVNWQKSF